MRAPSLQGISLGLSILALIALPLIVTNQYWLHVYAVALMNATMALGLQVLVGRAGLLSLGQGAFFGIGAYVAGWTGVHWGVPFLGSVVLGSVGAAAASLLLVPIVRLRGSSLAVATLGFGIVVHLVLLNEEWLTGGPMGLMGIPKPSILGVDLSAECSMYWFCLAMLLACGLACHRLLHSRFGRAVAAICQDETAAQAAGIRLDVVKSKCFLIAACLAGLAGGLYAFDTRYLSPNDFTFAKSIDVLIMVVIGGLMSLSGAVLGALLVVMMPEYLRFSGELRMILFGVAIIVLMGTGRSGIVGLLDGLAAQAMARLRRRRAGVALGPSL